MHFHSRPLSLLLALSEIIAYIKPDMIVTCRINVNSVCLMLSSGETFRSPIAAEEGIFSNATLPRA